MSRWLFLLLVLFVTAVARADTATTTPSASTPAAVVTLHGEVDDYTRDALIRNFSAAKKLGVKTVILDLDTPGGLVTAGLDISRFLRGQRDLHVIAYVSNEAYSAGSLIAVAANEIVMAPSAAIGDCAPIVFNTGGELQPMPAAERAKAQSPIISDFDASAARNGYDPALLESMVIVERTVYWAESPTGQRRFVDADEFTKLKGDGWHAVAGVPVPLDGPDTLFTAQTDEAVKIGLAKGTAESAADLAAQRNFTIVADYTPGAGEHVVELLNNAAVRSLLLTVFMACLYITLSAPGHGAAEATGIVALGLLIGIPLLTGYAQWWEVAAIFAGLGLLAFELLVFPGHGVSALAGICLLLGGLLFTFVGKEPAGLPGWLPVSRTDLRSGIYAITAALAASMLLSAWLRQYLPHLPYLRKLILTTTSGTPVSAASTARTATDVSPENAWPGVGTIGKAVTDLRPGGSAEFLDLAWGDNRTVPVVTEGSYVAAGTKLVVRLSRGNRIVVRPVSATEAARPLQPTT